MSEKNDVLVNEFTLGTGKKIYLREPEIEDAEVCAQVAGKLCDPANTIHLGMVMQKEMLKRLLVKVDTKVLKGTDREDLTSVFLYKEYNQAMLALKQVAGEDATEGNLVHQHVSFGGK